MVLRSRTQPPDLFCVRNDLDNMVKLWRPSFTAICLCSTSTFCEARGLDTDVLQVGNAPFGRCMVGTLSELYCRVRQAQSCITCRHCHQCKQARAATKTLALTRLPPILILHLSRTTYNDFGLADKDDRPVVYPVKHLNMSPFLHPVSESGESMYELYATINHVGSASFGSLSLHLLIPFLRSRIFITV